VTGSRIDAAVEAVFSTGLLLSGALLLLGLLFSRQAALRLGIMALIATPAAGTAVLAAGLLAKRDWLFALVSLWILAVLASSLLLAMKP
jgi:uncharacterized membrane protein